jgi:sugar phosphate isomerase/epimerase
MNRRTFIGTSLAATLATAAKPTWTAETTHKIDRVGLQLYTVRANMKTDFDGTIAKVAATGYKEVEFAGLFAKDAGYFGRSPKDVRALLDKNGLTSPSTHAGYDVVEKRWPEALEAAKIVGHNYIICPWIDETQRAQASGWQRAADLFNKAGEVSAKVGIQFGYHNHSFEFTPSASLGGKLPYDFFLEETDPKFVAMEMDLCWISVAGKDPVAYFDKYPGRFPLAHVKDWIKDPNATDSYSGATGSAVKIGGRLADVGQGSIDWKRIFAHSEKAGIKHYFVENDEPKSAFDDIKISYNYLHNLQF